MAHIKASLINYQIGVHTYSSTQLWFYCALKVPP